MSKNLVFHDKLKHIEVEYHYIRDIVHKGVVKLQYVATDDQIADVLTKPLVGVKFEYFREKLGVIQIEVSSKGNDETQIHSDRVKGLVPSMVRWKG